MARYLFTVWPFPGHLYPTLSVADALRRRGHDIAVYTGERASDVLGELGWTHFCMRHVEEGRLYDLLFPDDDRAARMSSLGELRRLRATLRTWLIATAPGQVADLEPILAEWEPDVLVCDPSMWAPFLILHQVHHIPVAIFSWTIACMLSGRGIPPWGRGMPLPTTPLRRLRVGMERILVGAYTREIRNAANALRLAYGLGPIALSVTDYAGTMPLYMVAGVPEYDYNRHDLPRSVHYVGRCVYERPAGQLPAWVRALPADRPLIYVTEGTVTAAEPVLLRAAADGLANCPVEVLLKDASVVRRRDAATATWLEDLAPNVRREVYLPAAGGNVLSRASVVITNGGAGSVMAALSAGVPLVVVPTAWDKRENAQRVVESGAGLRLSAAKLTPQRLRAAVERILRDPSYRENARGIAAVVARYGGPQRAALLLESLTSHREQPIPMEEHSDV
jgi:MGT family glycosyltransferase